ncbi:MAG: alanine racemase, partial [Verrucomicrobiota bacterium]|nr:alanine racemase [Verrucomicrobiota bacterium]
MSATRRCWAEINLAALRANARVAREKAGADATLMAIVKANAYGHDIAGVASALAGIADYFGVASAAEAQELGGFAGKQQILILGPSLPDERAEIVAHGFIPSISTFDEAAAFDRLAARPFPIHLIIDTGMGRIGVWQDEAVALAQKIAALRNITIAAIATHLPVADEDESFTRTQLARFQK